MEQQTATFFPGSNRRVILGSPTKHITSNRICIPIRMPLTGESVVGMPGWVAEAFYAVSKFAKEMSPEVSQVSDISLAFANEGKQKTTGELFENPNAKAPNSEMKNFTVLRVGDPDGDPEVELQFKAYMPFARELWRWVGEMGGKEVYMAFPSTTGKAVSIVKADDQAKLPIESGTALPADPSLEEATGGAEPPAGQTTRMASPKGLAGEKETAKRGTRSQIH